MVMKITEHIEGAKETEKGSSCFDFISAFRSTDPHYAKRHFALIGRLPPVCPTVRGIFSAKMDLMHYEIGMGEVWEGSMHNTTD